MSILDILQWPDERLTRACEPVTREDMRAVVQDMFDTMYAANGRGLAGPQVGIMERLFVMDCTWKEGEKTPVTFINPSIIAVEHQYVEMEEACLSIPGLSIPISRPVAVTVQWQSETGEFHMNDFDGFEARCIQHEMDHLNGRITLDHLPADERAAHEAAYKGHTQ